MITGADAEGAGEMFGVTNFDLDNIPRTEEGVIDYTQDFFGRKLTLLFQDSWKEKLQQWD